MEIEWSEPPDRNRTPYTQSILTPAIQEALEKNPRKWAIIMKNVTYAKAANAAYRLRKVYPNFEFRGTGDVGKNNGIVYARYNGIK